MYITIDTSRIVDELLADSAMAALTAAADSAAPLPLNADHKPMLLRAVRASFGRLVLALAPVLSGLRPVPCILDLPDWPELDPGAVAEGAALFIRLDIAARIHAASCPAEARRLAEKADEALRLLKSIISAAAPRPRRIRPGV